MFSWTQILLFCSNLSTTRCFFNLTVYNFIYNMYITKQNANTYNMLYNKSKTVGYSFYIYIVFIYRYTYVYIYIYIPISTNCISKIYAQYTVRVATRSVLGRTGRFLTQCMYIVSNLISVVIVTFFLNEIYLSHKYFTLFSSILFQTSWKSSYIWMVSFWNFYIYFILHV